MKISQLIKTLSDAQKQFGDVPVMEMDSEMGQWVPISQVSRLHPYTAPYGCLNRDEPVNGIALSRDRCGASDLLLGETDEK